MHHILLKMVGGGKGDFEHEVIGFGSHMALLPYKLSGLQPSFFDPRFGQSSTMSSFHGFGFETPTTPIPEKIN